MSGYMELLELAGWKYKSVKSPFVGQEKEKNGYFVHAATGKIVPALKGDKDRAAYSLVLDLASD